MKRLIPNFLKPILKPIYHRIASSYLYRKIICRPKKRTDLFRYWKQPWDGKNFPESYLEGEEKSQLLVKMVKNYSDFNPKILEIGCNVGRNLNCLFRAGFRKLYGVELSGKALLLLKKYYPEMVPYVKIQNLPIEEAIRNFKNNEFDIVFTMAVLEHIHTDSEWIFPEITRITKKILITIEDEHGLSWRHFPRNYKDIFESFGMEQIYEENCSEIKKLSNNFFVRIFRKKAKRKIHEKEIRKEN